MKRFISVLLVLTMVLGMSMFAFADDLQDMHCGKNGTLPKAEKSTSKYVHTWGSGKITIGFDIGGPSFGLTDCKKSWQIASSVNVPSA